MKFENIRNLRLSVIRRLLKQGFKITDIINAILNNAILNNAELNNAKLNNTNLNNAELNGVKLNGVKLNYAKLNGIIGIKQISINTQQGQSSRTITAIEINRKWIWICGCVQKDSLKEFLKSAKVHHKYINKFRIKLFRNVVRMILSQIKLLGEE